MDYQQNQKSITKLNYTQSAQQRLNHYIAIAADFSKKLDPKSAYYIIQQRRIVLEQDTA